MHKLFSFTTRYTYITIFIVSLFSCNDDEFDIYVPNETRPPYFVNNPLQKSGETYNILAIGNSYTEDGTAYIGEITKGLSIDPKSYCVYTLTKGSSPLQHWTDVLYNEKDTVTIYRRAGAAYISKRENTLANILSQDWDVVVLQQLSTDAIDYRTYNPYLRNLIDAVRYYCTNPNVCLAWQLIHAYGKDYTSNKGLIGDNRWEYIANATQSMMQHDGIDIIIPTGTAIQIARHSELENKYDLTRDNTHLCYGVGRYIAACCWVHTLFAPVYGCGIQKCTSLHPLSTSELQENDKDFIPESSTPVTEANQKACLNCVAEACAHPFQLE